MLYIRATAVVLTLDAEDLDFVFFYGGDVISIAPSRTYRRNLLVCLHL